MHYLRILNHVRWKNSRLRPLSSSVMYALWKTRKFTTKIYIYYGLEIIFWSKIIFSTSKMLSFLEYQPKYMYWVQRQDKTFHLLFHQKVLGLFHTKDVESIGILMPLENYSLQLVEGIHSKEMQKFCGLIWLEHYLTKFGPKGIKYSSRRVGWN